MNGKPTLIVVIVITVLHDLVDVVSCRNGRGDGIRVEDRHVFVASTGEVEGRGAAPGASADDED